MATAFPPPPGDGSQQPAQYQAPQAPQGQYAPAPGYGQPQYGAPPSKSNGLAITSLVLGIVALITVWLPPLAIVIALVGAVLGFLGLRKSAESGGRGLALGGLITSGLALLVSVVLLILTAMFFNAADDELDDWEDELNQINEQLEEDLQDLDTEG